jgi:hypothetical protein
VKPNSVTHIVETQGVCQLCEEQADDVAPRFERAALLLGLCSRARVATR